jgi:hypothetical protein
MIEKAQKKMKVYSLPVSQDILPSSYLGALVPSSFLDPSFHASSYVLLSKSAC